MPRTRVGTALLWVAAALGLACAAGGLLLGAAPVGLRVVYSASYVPLAVGAVQLSSIGTVGAHDLLIALGAGSGSAAAVALVLHRRRPAAPGLRGPLVALLALGALVALIGLALRSTDGTLAAFGWTGYSPISQDTYRPPWNPLVGVGPALVLALGAALVGAAFAALAGRRSPATPL